MIGDKEFILLVCAIYISIDIMFRLSGIYDNFVGGDKDGNRK